MIILATAIIVTSIYGRIYDSTPESITPLGEPVLSAIAFLKVWRPGLHRPKALESRSARGLGMVIAIEAHCPRLLVSSGSAGDERPEQLTTRRLRVSMSLSSGWNHLGLMEVDGRLLCTR